MKVSAFYKSFLESDGVSIDSRTIKSNQIFFAIKGDLFDGHLFIEKALSKNAAYVIIDNPEYASIPNTILVPDTLSYLQDLALHHRRQFDIPVLGLTGSNGKTTTKELLFSVLSRKYKVHATRGNFNNHIGVPLTLLAAPTDSELLIIEMGANHIGEIDFLCKIAEPTMGLITNIGDAHIEGFGSFEGVIEAKTELYRYLSSKEGIVFYDQNNPILEENLPGETQNIPYSVDLIPDPHNGLKLRFINNRNGQLYVTKLYGKYNLSNIVAAYTVAVFLDVDMNEICTALSNYYPQINRSQIIEKEGVTIILDAYNANPSSMNESLHSFMNLNSGDQGKTLILGDMNELGDNEIIYHKELIDLIKSYPWKHVVLVGQKFRTAEENSPFMHFDNVEEMIFRADLWRSKIQNTICLIKASRSLKLEKLVDHF